MANRIFEYDPSDESSVIERVLIQVHKAIDSKLPNAEKPPKRYSKTMFSDEESTAFVKIAVDQEIQDKQKETDNFPPTPIVTGRSNPGEELFSEIPTASLTPEKLLKDTPKVKTLENSPGEIPAKTNPESNFSDSAFEYTAPRSVTGGKDLIIVGLALLLLIVLAISYWYVFESDTTF